jgi:uroporphyrinogen decarboxylase
MLCIYYICLQMTNKLSFFNTTFIDALYGRSTTHTPVWLMRQAGRYLPEYLQTRKKAGSFMGLATNPELATEVTLQPLDRYALDAAILFSDILTIPDAMGLGLHFIQGEGPKFTHALKDEQAILNLKIADMHKLQYVFDAVAMIRKALDARSSILPLIGFSGSPFTLACYMTEGSGSINYFEQTRLMLYKRPDLVQHILNINTASIIEYLNQQIIYGVNAVMLFDTWGGLLSEENYLEYSLKPLQIIINALKQLHPHIPIIVFTKGGGIWLQHIASIDGIQCIGIDWTFNIGRAKQVLNQQNSNIALQGNLDPLILLSTPECIKKTARVMLEGYYNQNKNLLGYIANLGHGISQYTPPEHVGIYIETIHEISKELLALKN